MLLHCLLSPVLVEVIDCETYVAKLETLAAISVYTAYPSYAGRKTYHWIHNVIRWH